MLKADIVIVNWNAGQQLRDCLTSIERYGGGLVASVVVVDNGSTDGSADGLEDSFELPLRVVRNGQNRGFGAACNQGAALGNSAFILFLNPDARLFEGTLPAALAAFEGPESGDLGIVGVQLVDEAGEVARTCARFPRIGHFVALALGADKLSFLRGSGFAMRDWSHDRTRTVDEVMGAFFLVPREVFEHLGGFDERFFVYFEELDFCLRACQAGYRSLYLVEAQAFHASGGTSRQVKAYRLFYSLRSRVLYGFKHFPRWQGWALVGLTYGIEPLTRVAYSLLRRDWAEVRNTLKGCSMLWADLPAVVRRGVQR
jgi:GT2 family glycosyltransferase